MWCGWLYCVSQVLRCEHILFFLLKLTIWKCFAVVRLLFWWFLWISGPSQLGLSFTRPYTAKNDWTICDNVTLCCVSPKYCDSKRYCCLLWQFAAPFTVGTHVRKVIAKRAELCALWMGLSENIYKHSKMLYLDDLLFRMDRLGVKSNLADNSSGWPLVNHDLEEMPRLGNRYPL